MSVDILAYSNGNLPIIISQLLLIIYKLDIHQFFVLFINRHIEPSLFTKDELYKWKNHATVQKVHEFLGHGDTDLISTGDTTYRECRNVLMTECMMEMPLRNTPYQHLALRHFSKPYVSIIVIFNFHITPSMYIRPTYIITYYIYIIIP